MNNKKNWPEVNNVSQMLKKSLKHEESIDHKRVSRVSVNKASSTDSNNSNTAIKITQSNEKKIPMVANNTIFNDSTATIPYAQLVKVTHVGTPENDAEFIINNDGAIKQTKISDLITANPDEEATEDIKKIKINGANYKLGNGLPEEADAGDSMVYDGSNWSKQAGYGYVKSETIDGKQTVEGFAPSNSTNIIFKNIDELSNRLHINNNDTYYEIDLTDSTYLTGLREQLQSNQTNTSCKIIFDDEEYLFNISSINLMGTTVSFIGSLTGDPFLIQFGQYGSEVYYMCMTAHEGTSHTFAVDIQNPIQFEPKYISIDGFGYASNNSKKEYTISWDGDINGKEFIQVDSYTTLYKISNVFLEYDDIFNSSGTVKLGSINITLPVTDSLIVKDDHGSFISYEGILLGIISDGELEITVEEDGEEVEKQVGQGVWFLGDDSIYVSELTSIHLISSRYININDVLPSAVTGDALIYDGSKWVVQHGYGYITYDHTITWDGDIEEKDVFNEDYYKITSETPTDINALINGSIVMGGYIKSQNDITSDNIEILEENKLYSIQDIIYIALEDTTYKEKSISKGIWFYSESVVYVHELSYGNTNHKIDSKYTMPDDPSAGDAVIYDGEAWKKSSGYGYQTGELIVSEEIDGFTESSGLFRKDFDSTELTELWSYLKNICNTRSELIKIAAGNVYIRVNFDGNDYCVPLENASDIMFGSMMLSTYPFYFNYSQGSSTTASSLHCITTFTGTQHNLKFYKDASFKVIDPNLISKEGYGYDDLDIISWDGNTEIYESRTLTEQYVAGTYYKISDAPIDINNIYGGVMTYYIKNDSFIQRNRYPLYKAMFEHSDEHGFTLRGYFMCSDGTYTAGGLLQENMPKGTWVKYYINASSNVIQYVENFNLPIIHQINPKYIAPATTTTNGLMSSEDKTKLETITVTVPRYNAETDRGKILAVKSDGSGLEWISLPSAEGVEF